jgi:AraC family transcriptional regulator
VAHRLDNRFTALRGYVVDSSRGESIGSCRSGFERYGTQGLLASSVELGWSGLSAELRSHARGVISWNASEAEKEVVVAISPSDSPVIRSSGGVVDRTIAQRGTIWLCLPEDHLIEFSAPLPQMLHIYLPSPQFSADSLGVDVDHAAPATFCSKNGFHDPLIAEIAFAIVAEMRTPTAGGKLLAETLAVSLAARLMQRHVGLAATRHFSPHSTQGLDRRRLTRVKEYVAENLEADLTIAELAKVASLSRFHFARAFKAAVGQSPHQYVSTHRLERAKELLTRGEQPVLDIAIAVNFSSQANFTRAFRQCTGMTPGQYRRSFARY